MVIEKETDKGKLAYELYQQQRAMIVAQENCRLLEGRIREIEDEETAKAQAAAADTPEK